MHNVEMKTPITKDLKRRKTNRHLRIELRLLVENLIFPKGLIPACFLLKDIPQCVVETAKAFEKLGIREKGGQNKGEVIGYIQGVIGGYIPNGNGDPWCLSMVQCIVAFIEDFFQTESPFPETESVMNCFSSAKKIPDILLTEAEVGSFFLFQQGDKWMGHAGTVLEILPNDKMITFEGNTGHASIRDGDGAYFRERDQKVNGPLKTKGFVRVFPDNKIGSLV